MRIDRSGLVHGVSVSRSSAGFGREGTCESEDGGGEGVVDFGAVGDKRELGEREGGRE